MSKKNCKSTVTKASHQMLVKLTHGYYNQQLRCLLDGLSFFNYTKMLSKKCTYKRSPVLLALSRPGLGFMWRNKNICFINRLLSFNFLFKECKFHFGVYFFPVKITTWSNFFTPPPHVKLFNMKCLTEKSIVTVPKQTVVFDSSHFTGGPGVWFCLGLEPSVVIDPGSQKRLVASKWLKLTNRCNSITGSSADMCYMLYVLNPNFYIHFN